MYMYMRLLHCLTVDVLPERWQLQGLLVPQQ
jgi:hypothetical protein